MAKGKEYWLKIKVDDKEVKDFLGGSIKDVKSELEKINNLDLNGLQTQISNLFGKGFKSLKFQSELDSIRKTINSINSDLSKQTKEAIDSVIQKFNSLTKAVSNTNESMSQWGQFVKRLSSQLRTFVAYRIINTTATAIRDLAASAVELESSFANIQAITSASDTEMEKLRDTILRVGEASKYSVEEIAKATTMLGQAGLSADEINNVLETTTQLAAGTGSELSNTVDLMTSALAVWGLNSEEASHLSDVMVTGMNRTKATLETFRMAVQYAGATMASLNVSFDEFASVAAAASNAGLRASVVGTGLRAMTSELISPTKKMVRGLAELGLSTEDVNIESQGLVNVLYKLKNAGLTAANAYDLFGKRAAQFVLAAQGQLDVVDELRVAFNESGATLKAYGTQMDTISAQATALGNTIKEMAANILDSISWMIKGALKGINKALQGIKWLFSDKQKLEFKKVRNELEDSEKSAKTLYDFTEQLNKRDYGLDKSQALEDLNVVIEELNKKFDKNLDYVKSVDDLADAYERVKNAISEIDSDKVKALNVSRENEKERLLKNITPSASLEFKYGTDAWRIKDYTREYLTNIEESKGKTYKMEREIESLPESYEKEIRKVAFEKAKKIFEELPKQIESSIKNKSDNFKARSSKINEDFKTINDSIEKQQLELENSGKDYKVTTEQITKIGESAVKFVNFINDTYVNLKDENDKNTEKAEELLTQVPDAQEQADLIQSGKESKKKIINGLIDWLNMVAEKLDVDIRKNVGDVNYKQSLLNTIKSYTRNPLFTNKNAYQQYINQAKEDEKNANKARKTQREIEREKARKFNLKYQGLAIQQQADEYAAKREQAYRSGVESKLSYQDKSGNLSKAYSKYSNELSRYENLQTAIANKKTLEEYRKDYGALFDQVKAGKVNLEDADNKSDKLISKMIELDNSVQKAEGEFGDLNNVDLENITNEVEDLKKKLEDIEASGESFGNKLVAGFRATIDEMADSYTAAGIGSMIAQDLGNGVSDALYSIVDGTKSAKEAFSDMARSILQDISKMLIKMAVLKAMQVAVGFSDGGQVPSSNVSSNPEVVLGGEYANGGFIPKIRAALGTTVRGGVQGKDSVPAMLMPGEYVLKKSAVDALGTNFLNDLNNNAAQTLTSTAANMMQNPYESDSESEPTVVNVWVVSKEEEAKMGPRDVIATIGKDIMTGGQTRRLIQSVVAGRK